MRQKRHYFANLNYPDSCQILGDYFKQRTWKGLDDSVSDELRDLSIKQGLSGVAMGYSTVSSDAPEEKK